MDRVDGISWVWDGGGISWGWGGGKADNIVGGISWVWGGGGNEGGENIPRGWVWV